MIFKVGDIVKHASGAIGKVKCVPTYGKYIEIKITQYEDINTIGKVYDVLKTSLVKISITNYIKEWLCLE